MINQNKIDKFQDLTNSELSLLRFIKNLEHCNLIHYLKNDEMH